jgi:hypothetical protein
MVFFAKYYGPVLVKALYYFASVCTIILGALYSYMFADLALRVELTPTLPLWLSAGVSLIAPIPAICLFRLLAELFLAVFDIRENLTTLAARPTPPSQAAPPTPPEPPTRPGLEPKIWGARE